MISMKWNFVKCSFQRVLNEIDVGKGIEMREIVGKH